MSAGKVAIVTGASRGIGAAIARKLSAEGIVVVGTFLQDEKAAESLAHEISARGGEIEMIRADMADAGAVRSVVAETMDAFGRLDILVNNAAMLDFKPLDEVDSDHFGAIFDVNVRGPLLAMRDAARVMANPGRIINISSGAAQAAPPGWSVYAASKSALNTLTLSLAAELGGKGITVNVISPGITRTDMLDAAIPAAVQEQMVKNTALGRVGSPEDIADVVAFLASDAARWITGQIIGVNGGLR